MKSLICLLSFVAVFASSAAYADGPTKGGEGPGNSDVSTAQATELSIQSLEVDQGVPVYSPGDVESTTQLKYKWSTPDEQTKSLSFSIGNAEQSHNGNQIVANFQGFAYDPERGGLDVGLGSTPGYFEFHVAPGFVLHNATGYTAVNADIFGLQTSMKTGFTGSPLGLKVATDQMLAKGFHVRLAGEAGVLYDGRTSATDPVGQASQDGTPLYTNDSLTGELQIAKDVALTLAITYQGQKAAVKTQGGQSVDVSSSAFTPMVGVALGSL